MKTVDVEQGSLEWLWARAGVLTSSAFQKVFTPARLEVSKQSTDYAIELAWERVHEAPLSMGVLGGWADRGLRVEPEARRWYAALMGCDVEEPTFYLHDTLPAGASTDGIVDGGTGILEIKCRNPQNHLKSVWSLTPIAGRLQVQAELWVTGAEWCDVVAYLPGSGKGAGGRISRVRPDPEVQDKFEVGVPVFLEDVAKYERAIRRMPSVVIDELLDEGYDEWLANLFRDEVGDEGATSLLAALEASLSPGAQK